MAYRMSGTTVRVHWIYPKRRKYYSKWPKSGRNQNKSHDRCQGPSDGSLGGWSHDQFPKMVKKTKVVALHCSFQNLFESCSKVLLLWRYKVEHFEKRCVFFLFFAFFSMKTTPNHMISTHLGIYEKGLQLLCRGKNHPKRKVHTLKGKLTLRDHKDHW